MTSFEALELFAAQIQRRISAKGVVTKVVVTPSPVSEKGIHIKVSLLKCYKETAAPHLKTTAMIRVRIRVSGTAESMEALKMACDTVDALDCYLANKDAESVSQKGSRILLEDVEGNPVPNTRIVTAISPEDSFIPTPDTTEVQDVEDDRICTVYFPWENANGKMDNQIQNV